LAALDGLKLHGSCEGCDAHRTVKCVGHGLWVLDLVHEDGCPFAEGQEAVRNW
jgi:hypothetical protein